MDEEKRTDPQVEEQQAPHHSPVEEEYRDEKPNSPEVRDATTFLGLGVGALFAILLGLFAVLTAFFIVS